MNFCSVLKLTRVDVGNVSKKGKNMKGIITWSIFTRWFFNQILSIYSFYESEWLILHWLNIYGPNIFISGFELKLIVD